MKKRASAGAFARRWAVPAALLACGFCRGAETIVVPNASFEMLPTGYASPNVEAWQKAPRPAWYMEGGGFLWSQLVGAFKNTDAPSGDHIDNCTGSQAAWLFAVPEVAMFQDYDTVDFNDPAPTHAFNAIFEVGKTYTLTVGLIGGGGGMLEGASLQISLYYRDAVGQKVTVAASTVINSLALFPTTTHFVDGQVRLPVVRPGDACVGQKIGVQLLSTISPEAQGGYWDVDNVRLVSTSEPALQSTPAGSSARIAFLAATRSSYQLQTSPNLQSWTPDGSPVLGAGTEVPKLFPLAGPAKFFRVVVTPVP